MKPRRSATSTKKIDVLDLGFEDAQRLHELSSKRQHKGKRFMGIEWTKRKGLVTRRPNLKLVWGDVISKLKRLAPESVKIVTADYLFTEFKIDGSGLGDFGRHFENFLAPKYKEARTQTIREVKRVLTPKGRFVLIEYNGNIHFIQEMLDKLGFSYTVKPLPASEMHKTKFLKIIAEDMEKHPERKEMVTPMRIIARKK